MHTRSLLRRAAPPRRGGALVLALITVMLVTVMTVGLVQISGATARRQTQALDRGRAFYLAEAGLAEAYTGLMVGKTGNIASAEQPARFGQGVVWVEATELERARVELVSTALCGGGRAVLTMVAERGEQSVATLGLFAAEGLTVPPGSTLDGYDSSEQGGLVGGGDRSAGRVGSNDAIALEGSLQQPTTVVADLAPGVGKAVTKAAGVTHTGGVAPRTSPAVLPPVEPPFEPELAGRKHENGAPLLVQPGDVGLAYLHVAGGGVVVLRGPMQLVVEDLRVDSKGVLEIDNAQGTVAVYATGSVELARDSMVSATSTDPSQLLVQLAGEGTVSLAGTAKLHGVVYAPEGRIVLGSRTEVFGAAVARSLQLAPGAKLHFDRNLDAMAAQSALPRLISWRVLELSSPQAASLARDPFQLLGLDPTALPALEEAHHDQVLHVEYEDHQGASHTYDGLESGFDWKKVKKAKKVQRDGTEVLHGVEPQAAPPPPPPSTAVLDALNQMPALSSSKLKDILLAASPLVSAELVAAIQRQPWLNDSDLKAVLEQNAPLGSTELHAMIDRKEPLGSSKLKDVMLASSPLPADVLARVLLGGIGLSASDTTSVLKVQ